MRAVSEPFSPGVRRAAARLLRSAEDVPYACPRLDGERPRKYIPQVKMDRLNQLRLEQLEVDEERRCPLWACTGCRHCTMYCDHANEPGLVRSRPRGGGAARHPASRTPNYSERFRAREARLGTQLRAMFPDQLATESGANDVVGLWPGCDAIDKGAGDIAASLAIFERVGIGVKLVDAPQACAGYPLLAAGHRDLFRWHAGRVATSLRGFRKVRSTARRVFTRCARNIRRGREPPHRGGLARELLAPAASSLACSLTRRSVYYHDPCYHARYNNVVEQPRKRCRSSSKFASSVGTRRHRVLRWRWPPAEDDAARRR